MNTMATLDVGNKLGVLIGLAFSAFCVAAGFVLIYGTKNRWPILTDPPEDLWVCYSQSFVKRVFGKQYLIYETYVIGVICFLVGMLGLISLFVSYLRKGVAHSQPQPNHSPVPLPPL